MIDTNVAIDALDRAADHHEWAVDRLGEALGKGAFFNHIVVAELAVRAKSAQRLDDMIAVLGVPVEPLDVASAFRAGRAFADWIDNGGRRGALLPDFLIGAHAETRGAAVLTRDTKRFRAYFPDLTLITPETLHG